MWSYTYADGCEFRVKNLYWDKYGRIIYSTDLSKTVNIFKEVIRFYQRQLIELENNPEKNKNGTISKLYLNKIQKMKNFIQYYENIYSETFSNSIQYILEE